MTVEAIYKAIDAIAPFSESMDFDNTGILVGDPQAEVTDALLCLDVTPRVLREACELGVQLIISHHPVIFTPLRAVPSGTIVFDLIRSGINVISAHTNLDKAYPYGVNHALAEALGLQNVHGVIADANSYIAYMGELTQEMTPEVFGAQIKEALGLKSLCYTPANRMIRTVAVVGGAGGEYAAEAVKCGADAFVTGEVKQHEAIAARADGLALYEAGHYHTEHPYRQMLADYLTAHCPGVRFRVSKSERPPMESL